MEVRPGYKQTEVGVIPADWNVVYLSEISSKITDGEHVTPIRTRQGNFLLSARNILNGRIDVSDVDYVGNAEFARIKQRCNPQAGDILISCSGTIGRVTVVPDNFKCVLVRSAALAKLDLAKVDSAFIQFWLQAGHAQGQIFRSVNQGAQPNLFLNHIERLQCPAPSLHEQRAISTALSDVDALLAKLDQFIAKKRDLKQAAMQQLLTGQTRLPGFSGAWKMKSMKSLGQTYGGLVGKTKADFGHGQARYIPFMNVMTDTVIDPQWLESVDVAANETQNLTKAGDLFFNGSSETPDEVGYCAVLCENIPDLYLNSFCFGFRFKADVQVNGLFFAYWFRSVEGRKAMSVLAQGATRYNIAKSAFLRLEIPQPKEGEQTAIATVLSDMDAELTVFEARRHKTRALKQGMMQELLTGRIRLV